MKHPARGNTYIYVDDEGWMLVATKNNFLIKKGQILTCIEPFFFCRPDGKLFQRLWMIDGKIFSDIAIATSDVDGNLTNFLMNIEDESN